MNILSAKMQNSLPSNGVKSSQPEPKSVDGQKPQISKQDKFREVAKQFESIFIEMVLKSMRDTVVKSEFIDGGNAEKIYQSMLDKEYSSSMAGTGMTGLADALERQFADLIKDDKPVSIQSLKQKALTAYNSDHLQNSSQ